MKKYLIILIFLICLSINTYNAFNINECTNELKLSNLNSKNALEYIKENDLTDKIIKICSSNICMKINSATLERDINNFNAENINYLKNKDEEAAINAGLKGFKIEKIIINSCL
jgi:hypothetical protein